MDYTVLNSTRGRIQLASELRKILTSDNYDADERGRTSKWSITEMINKKRISAITALCMLTGKQNNGRNLEAGHELRSAPKEYRLHVLTRQACTHNKDGNNEAVVLPKSPTFDDCVAFTDEPFKGDFIRVKGDSITVDPDTGEKLNNKAARSERIMMGKGLHSYTDYYVDKDNCITVPFEHALQLLSQNGERLGRPQFNDLNSNVIDSLGRVDRKQRKITNWYYREVPVNFKMKKKATPTPAQQPVVEEGK